MSLIQTFPDGGGTNIPNGSTVTPTDDIQTWLKCAELTETYTTLNEVLTDNDVMEKLFRSENASDYLVRSTTWASDIVANQTAMILIGKNDYCADKLLNDSTWKTAIINSGYWDSILIGLVPIMTSNITPYGEAFDMENDSIAYKAFMGLFDGSRTFYPTSVTQTNWVAYDFKFPVLIYKVGFTNFLYTYNSTNYWGTKTYQIQYSDDKSTWTDATSVLTAAFNTTKQYINISSSAHRYWRFYISSSSNSTAISSSVNTVQFYGKLAKTTIYSAANDIVSFVDDEGAKVVKTDATGKGEVTIVCKPNTDITFTSSVAKNPDNLSENYSKVVTVKSSAEPVYVMPNKDVMYWWGYKSNNLENQTTDNGWATYGSRSFVLPTYNANYISFSTTSSTNCGIGNKNSINFNNVNVVFETIQLAFNVGLNLTTFDSKSRTNQTPNVSQTVVNTIQKLVSNTPKTNGYLEVSASAGREGKVYALWYDSDDDDSKAEISAIGTNEDKPTASRAYAVGEHFYKNGKFCTAIAAIAQGAMFTLGTNYVEGTIAEAIGCKTELIYTLANGDTTGVNIQIDKYKILVLVIGENSSTNSNDFCSNLLPVSLLKQFAGTYKQLHCRQFWDSNGNVWHHCSVMFNNDFTNVRTNTYNLPNSNYFAKLYGVY